MLFIDFETPHRVRIHGIATVASEDTLLADFYEAELIVRVTITEIFENCPRYIHKYKRVNTSKYVPQADCKTPTPQWKRIDVLQDVLPTRDKLITDESGGTITPDEYAELVKKGTA